MKTIKIKVLKQHKQKPLADRNIEDIISIDGK